MKQIFTKIIVSLITGFLLFNSCTDEFLREPESDLKIYIKNEADELEIPDAIYAGETKLYFANEGVSFFSVVYPGDKILHSTDLDEDGDSIYIWKKNQDYEDINNPDYFDTSGKRAVKGLPLSYQDNYNISLSQSWFRYTEAGTYTIYLEATNTNEDGEVVRSLDSVTIIVLE